MAELRILTLPAATLAAYAGHYAGANIPDIAVAIDGDGLKLTAGDLVVNLRAETPTRFFALERDLRFDSSIVARLRPKAAPWKFPGPISRSRGNGD